ncbi:hypothetical protein M427DRAFT_324811 [Gonapodya prolifera JEL478]|uniref:Glycosyl transferase family 25 domain-containing protein n=1 Tax=Gonapodya prolifera (strain JEL478) TaxID=1344416 RepID=A0A139AF84_GONPJ|nr:hypothetical protein M427DRAFT_324811 [Gonapodya prolifera JEL478]|eukprot:KXS15418.1 hypothetical protein M427DRAFT_324811 [Gonapodya prolifera JEL478]
MTALLNYVGVPFEFVDAHDHLSPDVRSRPEMGGQAGGILSPGGVACYLSHRAVWERLSQDVDPRPSLVLEDDVDVEADMVETLRQVLETLSRKAPDQAKAEPFRWDILYAGHCFETVLNQTTEMKDAGIDSRVRPGFEPACTHGEKSRTPFFNVIVTYALLLSNSIPPHISIGGTATLAGAPNLRPHRSHSSQPLSIKNGEAVYLAPTTNNSTSPNERRGQRHTTGQLEMGRAPRATFSAEWKTRGWDFFETRLSQSVLNGGFGRDAILEGLASEAMSQADFCP